MRALRRPAAAASTTRRSGLTAVLAGLLVTLSVVGSTAVGARAATAPVKVMLSATGASTTTAPVGAQVVFVNTTMLMTLSVRSSSANWSFRKDGLAPGQTSAASAALTKAGSYTFAVTGGLTGYSGAITVSAAAPSPTPSAAPIVPPTASPRPTTSPAPKPSTSAAPVASPAAASPVPVASGSAAPAAVGGSGTAAGPPIAGFSGDVLPGLPPSLPGAPAPNIAGAPPLAPVPVVAGATNPDGTVADAASAPGPQARRGVLAQRSPHRYGLPATLAVVAITGIVSLLVRLLLSHPAARRRRELGAGPVVTATD